MVNAEMITYYQIKFHIHSGAKGTVMKLIVNNFLHDH